MSRFPFNVLFSYNVLARGDKAAQLETAKQTWGQNLFNILYLFQPHARNREEKVRMGMLEHILVCLQILIDLYICDQ